MMLKKLYEGEGPDARVVGIKVLRPGARVKHLSQGFIDNGVREGWLSMTDGKVVLHVENNDVVYKIEAFPGYFCCHCDKSMDSGPGARAHLDFEHSGVSSPDSNNPSGYRRDNFYLCVRQEN